MFSDLLYNRFDVSGLFTNANEGVDMCGEEKNKEAGREGLCVYIHL